MDNFGRQIVRRANNCLGLGLGFAENTGNTEIAQLDHVVLSEENVLGFEISVQYLPIVNVLQCKANLGEPIENVVLAPILQLPTSLLLLLVLVLNSSLQVAAVRVVHHDAELSFLCLVDFAETNNVWMLEHFQDLGLSESFPSLVLIHVLDIDLLDNCVPLIRLALYEVGCTEGANTQRLNFLVRFVLLLGRL